MTEPEYGEITRGDLMAALPATARIQLVSTTAEAARALADGGTVSRVYQNSLTEYAPEGDVVYIVTDTATLAGLGAEYTVLRDYGDVFWSVRMNINDLTANFTTEFVLPEARSTGSDAEAEPGTAASRQLPEPFRPASRSPPLMGSFPRGLRPRKKAPLLGKLAELARPEGS